MFVAAQTLNMARLGLATGIYQSSQLLENLEADSALYDEVAPGVLANVETATQRLEELGLGHERITRRLLAP